MGLQGVSITSLVLIFLIVLLVFGSKRFKTIGSDLGQALRGFRKSVSEDTVEPADPSSHEMKNKKASEPADHEPSVTKD